MRLPTILIVDDEALFANALAAELRLQGQLHVLVAADGTAARQLAREHVLDIILLDQQLPDVDGPTLCPQLLASNPRAKVLFATAHASIENARQAVLAGAFDYLPKPIGLEEILLAIERCRAALAYDRADSLLRYHRARDSADLRLVGEDPMTRELRGLIAHAATVSAPVLISGETGTGKGLVARSIHFASSRRDGELVHVNCASIPETLVEAELFGTQKGAFTGASSEREGLIELADGGTLFLDEIAEMPVALQPKLLSVLEDRVVRRIGSGRSRAVDFRLITATNVDIAEALRGGRLRPDLYYRIDVLRIHVPALRERFGALPALALHLLHRVAPPEAVLDPDELRALTHYSWPGNVRELRNVLERAWFLSRGGPLRPSQLLPPTTEPVAPKPHTGGPPLPLADVESRAIREALAWAQGNRARAARALGISLSTLKRRLDRPRKAQTDTSGPS